MSNSEECNFTNVPQHITKLLQLWRFQVCRLVQHCLSVRRWPEKHHRTGMSVTEWHLCIQAFQSISQSTHPASNQGRNVKRCQKFQIPKQHDKADGKWSLKGEIKNFCSSNQNTVIHHHSIIDEHCSCWNCSITNFTTIADTSMFLSLKPVTIMSKYQFSSNTYQMHNK